jgi:hypothetical protein
MTNDQPGYTDTPELPHCEYRVHDADRPRPESVTPGSPHPAGDVARAPSDATVLLDGSGLDGWVHDDGSAAAWRVEEDSVVVEPGTGDIRTESEFGDCHLHVEWAAPPVVDGESQGRGNSGVFLMDRYEIQVLDNYENPTYADGYAGAVYGQHPPAVNACREPGAWQTYDILWTAPRFDGAELASPARVTVLHNGVVVQDDVELIGATTHREVGEYSPHPPEAPLRLQDHGDEVRFRNVWYRERG